MWASVKKWNNWGEWWMCTFAKMCRNWSLEFMPTLFSEKEHQRMVWGYVVRREKGRHDCVLCSTASARCKLILQILIVCANVWVVCITILSVQYFSIVCTKVWVVCITILHVQCLSKLVICVILYAAHLATGILVLVIAPRAKTTTRHYTSRMWYCHVFAQWR